MRSRATDLLDRLRSFEIADRLGDLEGSGAALLAEWQSSGVRFASSSEAMERQYYRAIVELFSCIRPAGPAGPILHEGGIYQGCWLESTGTINAELLSRFLPSVAARTFMAFAEAQRDDGLLPYKITADGPVFAQIQTVTPLARSVWTHHRLNGSAPGWLETLYNAMRRNDDWLARWRDTRGTGAVEAFCCYDTGHDLSPRFWHIPDSPLGNDPTAYDTANPLLPLVAPDLTASVACSNTYLARMAELLGEDPEALRDRSSQLAKRLMELCYDPEDGCFYDNDRNGAFVRVQSDVLLRVLACEIGDGEFFADALRRYLLNTRKFFAKFPFTSIALDDPRYDPAFDYNSWAGPTNFLSLIRAPHAFEHHHRHVELSWVLQPILQALAKAERFSQTLHPFTGRCGFTGAYSPAILCLLDFVERLCGIQPRPDGTLWFTGLTPVQLEHRDVQHETAYGRRIDGHDFELVNTASDTMAYRDGERLWQAPRGVRIVTDRTGAIKAMVGLVAQDVEGTLSTPAGDLAFRIAANEEQSLVEGRLESVRKPGLVPPGH